jgi:hypothetical protein
VHQQPGHAASHPRRRVHDQDRGEAVEVLPALGDALQGGECGGRGDPERHPQRRLRAAELEEAVQHRGGEDADDQHGPGGGQAEPDGLGLRPDACRAGRGPDHADGDDGLQRERRHRGDQRHREQRDEHAVLLGRQQPRPGQAQPVRQDVGDGRAGRRGDPAGRGGPLDRRAGQGRGGRAQCGASQRRRRPSALVSRTGVPAQDDTGRPGGQARQVVSPRRSNATSVTAPPIRVSASASRCFRVKSQ